MGSKRSILKTFVGIAALAASAGLAHAQALTCATMMNTPIAASGVVMAALNVGDQVTVTPGSGSTSIQFEGPTTSSSCGFFLTTSSCSGSVFTATETGTFTFEEVSGRVGGTLTCSEGTGGTGGTGGGTMTTATAATNAAAASATSSLNRMNGFGQNNGTPGVSATRNGLRFSTSGEGGLTGEGWTFWGDAGFQRFDGGIDGDNFFFTLGADTYVGGTSRLGFMIDYSDLDATVGGTAVTTEAFTFGPYVSIDLNGKWSIDAFLAFGQPDYVVGGTAFSADRTLGGISLNADYMVNGVAITSFISADGFSEDHPVVGPTPARTISNMRASLGARAEFNPGESVRPYLSIAAEVSEFDNGLGTQTSNFSPRLGAGMTVDGDLGSFNFNVEGGEIIDGTRDYTFSLGYEARF